MCTGVKCPLHFVIAIMILPVPGTINTITLLQPRRRQVSSMARDTAARTRWVRHQRPIVGRQMQLCGAAPPSPVIGRRRCAAHGGQVTMPRPAWQRQRGEGGSIHGVRGQDGGRCHRHFVRHCICRQRSAVEARTGGARRWVAVCVRYPTSPPKSTPTRPRCGPTAGVQ